MVVPIGKGDFNTSCTLQHYFPGRFHAIEMEPFWRIHFYFIRILCAEGNDLLLLLMAPAMWHLKRAVELVVCKTSWLIEHWKVCLMVGEVGLGAEAGDGVDVEEEEVSGSLGMCQQSKKTFGIQKVNMYQKYTTRPLMY
jgi:hypothetical protein